MEPNNSKNNYQVKEKKLNKINQSLLNTETTQELLKIKEILSTSINDKTELSSLSDIYKNIFHSLYENYSYKYNYEIITEIINLFKNYISLDINSKTEPLIFMEKLLMLFLFHFDQRSNQIGFELLKYLIDNIEMSFSNSLLSYFCQLLKILNIKKNILTKHSPSSIVLSIVLYNISVSIYIILSDNQIFKENKTNFISFIKKNIKDIGSIYVLFIPYDNNFYLNQKIFEENDIKYIYENLGENLNKTLSELSNEINLKNKNKNPDSLILSEKINIIGSICKILNSITDEGSRTYSMDKVIKNLIITLQKILTIINSIKELNIQGLLFEVENIENIFEYCIKLKIINYDNILKLFTFVNKMYNNYPCEYLIIMSNLVKELNKIILAENENSKLKVLLQIVLQILETIFKKNKSNNQINLQIYELIKINQIYYYIINYKNEIEVYKEKFPNVFNYFNGEIDKGNDILKGFLEKNDNYLSQIYLDCIAEGNKINNIKKNKSIDKNLFINCLEKFEQFKNCIKETLDLKGISNIEKNIEEEKKQISKSDNLTFEDFQDFFLNNSMEMLQELFK